jgi:hypothetical protein
MKNLYDLLGARPDAEQRAAYNRFLEFQRKPLRTKLKRGISELKQHILHDAVAAVVLAIVLAGGYTLFVRISETPVDEAAGTTGDELKGTLAVRAARRNGAERDNLDHVAVPLMPIVPQAAASVANDPNALEMTEDEPVPRQAGQTIDVARHDDLSGVAIEQPSATAGESDPVKSQRVRPLDRHQARSAGVAFAALGGRDFGPNASSSGGDKLGNKSSELGGRNTRDLKVPKIKTSARPLPAVKREAASRPPIKQALLQDRNTSACASSQSCSGRVPPLFGVGP